MIEENGHTRYETIILYMKKNKGTFYSLVQLKDIFGYSLTSLRRVIGKMIYWKDIDIEHSYNKSNRYTKIYGIK